MKLVQLTTAEARIDVTVEELFIINNALNEMCHGIDLPEFETRVGVTRERAQSCLDEVRAIIDKVRLAASGHQGSDEI